MVLFINFNKKDNRFMGFQMEGIRKILSNVLILLLGT